MTIPLTAFSVLVGLALLATIAAPIVLLALLVSDWRKGQLW